MTIPEVCMTSEDIVHKLYGLIFEAWQNKPPFTFALWKTEAWTFYFKISVCVSWTKD